MGIVSPGVRAGPQAVAACGTLERKQLGNGLPAWSRWKATHAQQRPRNGQVSAGHVHFSMTASVVGQGPANISSTSRWVAIVYQSPYDEWRAVGTVLFLAM